MGKKKHVSWDFFKDNHKGGDYGCIWRHSGGWGSTPCHYAMNGYKESGSRLDMYNKDHRANAKAMGYVIDASGDKRRRGDLKLTSRISKEVGAKSRTARKAGDAREAFRKLFEGRFGGSIKWLSLNEKGWHYGYTLPAEHAPKKYTQGPQPTFQVKNGPAEGYGAWYPYHHNYHHLIPQGALQEHVCGDDAKTKDRVEVLCASKWNINGPNNIVLLPQELAVSKIVELPAHCPWGLKKHAAYSASMKKKLKIAKQKLDKAVQTKACEDTEDVAVELDSVSEDVLKKVKKMQPGRQIGRVS
ncbi:AHH domain-containing protein [Pyxidicoccus sp. 3LG]